MTFCAAYTRHSFTAVTFFPSSWSWCMKMLSYTHQLLYIIFICTHDTDTDNNARLTWQYIILQISKWLNHSRKLLQFPLCILVWCQHNVSEKVVWQKSSFECSKTSPPSLPPRHGNGWSYAQFICILHRHTEHERVGNFWEIYMETKVCVMFILRVAQD